MREIFFRFYDKTEGKYRQLDGLHDMIAIEQDGKVNYCNLQNGSGGDEYIIEQFTGLLDREGKKIFEGDIFGGDLEMSYIKHCDKCKSFQLFNCVDECLACSGDIWWSEVIDWVSQVPVIGNIHDNPELLDDRP
jgi:hypothetical protein